MQPLSHHQKQSLFDYALDLATEQETAQAEDLIAENREAAEIHSRIKAALAPLDTLSDDPCPADLAQRTVWRLRQAADARLPVREPVTTASRPWLNLAEAGAVVAAVLVAIGVLVPSFGFARHLHQRHVCRRQLAGIGSSIARYSSDHDDKLPAVTADVSLPWCRAAGQGEQRRSNSSNLYLLLEFGYHERPEDFVCSGRWQKRVSPLTVSAVTEYSDFPSVEHINYSFRVFCRPGITMSLFAGQPLLADRNPVFEKVPEDRFPVQLDSELCRRNSSNHGQRGQNILFVGGQVRFLTTRHVGVPQDDIFTVQNVVEYRGIERPLCEKDPFLAP
jgi:hypothetical protein